MKKELHINKNASPENLLFLACEKWKSSIFAVIWPESSDTEPFMANNSVAKTFSKGILHISQHNTTYDQLIIVL